MPMKLITHHEWVDAPMQVVERGRKQNVEVVVHTHFNHPKEITDITGAGWLCSLPAYHRAQSVGAVRGVNDDPEIMKQLVRRLSYVNVHPYYVYVHDLVTGAEDLRTTVQTAPDEKAVAARPPASRRSPSWSTPRAAAASATLLFEHYNRETGVSVYRSPSSTRTSTTSTATRWSCSPRAVKSAG